VPKKGDLYEAHKVFIAEHENTEECAICLEPMLINDRIRACSEHHLYHPKSFDEYICRDKRVCPSCQIPLILSSVSQMKALYGNTFICNMEIFLSDYPNLTKDLLVLAKEFLAVDYNYMSIYQALGFDSCILFRLYIFRIVEDDALLENFIPMMNLLLLVPDSDSERLCLNARNGIILLYSLIFDKEGL
jgi:hypothetical protein